MAKPWKIDNGIPGVEERPYIPPSNGDDNTPPKSRPTRRTRREPREVTVNGTARGLPIPAIFGKQRTGAQFVYANSFSNGTVLYLVAVHCYGPVKSITPRADDVALTFNGSYWQDTTGLLKVWNYDGSQTSIDTASGLRTFDSSFDEFYQGLAYSIIKITFNKERMNQRPELTFDIEGYRSIYDPRTDTRGYSENPALFIRELLTNSNFGLRVPDNTTCIDDASFVQAANDCDASIFPATPTTAITAAQGGAGNVTALNIYRYVYTHVNADGLETLIGPASTSLTPTANCVVNLTLPANSNPLIVSRKIYRSVNGAAYRLLPTAAGNGTSYTDNNSPASTASAATPPTKAPRSQRYYAGITVAQPASGSDWLDTLRAHCMGVISIDNGRYQLRIDKPVPAGYQPKKFSVSSFSDYDGSTRPANVDRFSISIERKERALLFNQIAVNYTDVANGFTSGSVTRERPRVTSFQETPRLATYDLQGLPDKNIATRIAVQYLNRAHDDLLVRFRASRDAISVLPWDVIHFTGHGLSGQLLRVLSVQTMGEDFAVTAIEYQPASYSDVINAEDASVSSDLPDPSAVPPDPSAVSVTEDRTIGPNGLPTSKIKIDFTPAESPFYRATRIVVDDGLTSYTLTETEVGPVYITAPRKGIEHTITLYTLTHRNISQGVSVKITPVFTNEVVPDVASVVVPFTYEEQGTISFNPASNYEYASHFEITDTFGAPANPPVIANIPASLTEAGVTVKVRHPEAVHGDGFNSPRTLSIVIKTVSVTGEKSGGVPATWTVQPNGIGTIQVGFDPRDAIYDGSSSIWVTNYGSNTVQKLDASTQTVLSTFTTATKPYGVTYVSGSTPYVYFSNYGSNSVSRMTESGTRSDIALGAGTGPLGIIYDGSAVWVTCHTSNQVKRIVGTTVTNTITVGTKPCLLYHYSGKIYVCNYGSNTVSVISRTTNAVVATIQVGNGPFGLCEAGGYIWVANYSGSTLSKINPTTNSVVATITLGTQTGPTDLAFDGDSGVWVSEALAKQVTRINIYSHKADSHIGTPASPRTVIYTGSLLYTPNNTNGTSGTISVTATNPAPAGGTSNAYTFAVTGADISPLPA